MCEVSSGFWGRSPFSFINLRDFLFILDSKGWENRPYILIGVAAKLHCKGQGHSDKWKIVIVSAHCDHLSTTPPLGKLVAVFGTVNFWVEKR